jgi:septal ring factor EnvC (AmiA/AmiB activator)
MPHHNPRQREVWELQSGHHERLNYLHFKARLEGQPARAGDSAIPEQAAVADDSRQTEEQELIDRLRRETELLEDARRSTTAEIDRCKKMLKEFREQRQRKLAQKQKENRSREQVYEEELRQLRQAIENYDSEINISIRKVDYIDGSDAEDVSALNQSSALRARMPRNKQPPHTRTDVSGISDLSSHNH